ncbi:Alg9-like mannosyltransferase family-domain-containing protein [Tuber indicum]|nr:Alg9-like mannosyltransferase family-domain-containing protein [Tuber indicum]
MLLTSSLGALQLLTVLTHLVSAPYTKVEESFNLQATHDILQYGLATVNATASLQADYDHFTFPGAVPRTFVGPVILSGLSSPLIGVVGGRVNGQLVVRGVLGGLSALSLNLFTRAVRQSYGSTTAVLYTLFQLSQFHLPYYSSRLLPNTFALILSTTAFSFLLPAPGTPSRRQVGHYKVGIYILTFTSIVFRSELAILLTFVSLQLLLTRRIHLGNAIVAGVAGGVIGLGITLGIDSYFWQSYTPAAPFNTPLLTEKTGLIWPELSGFLYNAIENKSSDWGTSPWHYYFTNSLPKLLLNPLLLLLIPAGIYNSPRTITEAYILPALGFVSVYSVLPHKEWRFIVYVVPILTLYASVGGAWVLNRRSKSPIYALTSLAIIASILLASLASASMLLISSYNYPGGQGINKLHRHILPSFSRSPPTLPKVHLDTLTCMTGATRFLQDAPLYPSPSPHTSPSARSKITFDKTEDETTLLTPSFWSDIQWVITSSPPRIIGKYEVVDSVTGWAGIRIYRPGEKVWLYEEPGLEEQGADKPGVGNDSRTRSWIGRGIEDGWGVRDLLLRGWWVGVRMEELVWVLRKQDGESSIAMVVLAASICTRGGKAVLSRQFREMPRSRIEGLLASFPKLTDTGTQHTTIETENVRYVYQLLDELYLVLITNRQSNILQDIDSLHLFAQVVSSICKSLDEREILKHSFELLSAFDEVVCLGYRENLGLQQVKAFLEMESQEEKIQEIISRNKEFEATEERKRKAKQLDLQRKEMSRNPTGMGSTGRSGGSHSSHFPTYTPTPKPAVADSYDTYEKKKTFSSAPKGKGMQLGRKSKTTEMFDQVRNELSPEAEERAPLVQAQETVASPRQSFSGDRKAIQVTISEQISAELSRDGGMKSFEVKGDLQLKILDQTLSKVKLNISANTSDAQFRTHPNVDRALFNGQSVIQLKDQSRGFPQNQQIGVLRWRTTTGEAPLSFTIWVNAGSSRGKYNVTVEYELSSDDTLRDVVVSIPFRHDEPSVTSVDEVYEVAGDSLDWTLLSVSEDNATGSFEFEAEADSEGEFFPMTVRFRKEKPIVHVDVDGVTLIEVGEGVDFSREIKVVADNYVIN